MYCQILWSSAILALAYHYAEFVLDVLLRLSALCQSRSAQSCPYAIDGVFCLLMSVCIFAYFLLGLALIILVLLLYNLHCFMFRMLQTFTAEKLNDHGFGRQTFALEADLYPKCRPCLIFESQLSVSEVHKMTGTELWTYFARELMSSEQFKEGHDQCKWFAFMSFTRYYVPPSTNPPSSHSEVVSLTKGHTALGMHCVFVFVYM